MMEIEVDSITKMTKEVSLPQILEIVMPILEMTFEYDVNNMNLSINHALHQITYKLIQSPELYAQIPYLKCGTS